MKSRFDHWQNMARKTYRDIPRSVDDMEKCGSENLPRLTACRGKCGMCFGIKSVPPRYVRYVFGGRFWEVAAGRDDFAVCSRYVANQHTAAFRPIVERVFGVLAASQYTAAIWPITMRVFERRGMSRYVFPTPYDFSNLLRWPSRYTRYKKTGKTYRDIPHIPRAALGAGFGPRYVRGMFFNIPRPLWPRFNPLGMTGGTCRV